MGVLSRPHHRQRCLNCYTMLVLALLISVSSLIEASILGYPLHASCELTWTFTEPCDSVKTKIEDQITAWDTEVCPMTSPGCSKLPCGQRCLYKLTGSEATSVTGPIPPQSRGTWTPSHSTSRLPRLGLAALWRPPPGLTKYWPGLTTVPIIAT